MFSQLKRFLSSELSNFKNELKRQNDDSIDNAVKRIRLEQSARHSFKSEGNEEQFKDEEQVAGHIDSALHAFQSRNFLGVQESLEQGKNLINTRMKHIILADLHGWDFVNEYKQDPIIEDDSDEKRMCKVLKSVESQRERKKVEKAKKANKFKSDSNKRSFVSTRFPNESSASSSMNACYTCGKPGHFWRTCLYRSRNLSGASANPNAGFLQRQLVQLQPQSTLFPVAAQPK
jgi:hypothetical protein